MIKFLFLVLFLLCFGFVFSQYLIFDNCLVVDVENNSVVNPTFVDLNNRGVYEYFKEEARPKLMPWLRPDAQISLYSGVSFDKLRCE